MGETKFTTNQYDSAYPDGIELHYWSSARNYVIKKELKRAGLTDKRALEIGCGRGVVLRDLRNSGFDCYGVELAPVTVPGDLRGFLFSGIGFENLDQNLAQSIEVVMLFDVIEHIEDDVEFLKKITQFFPNLTHVVIAVPARQELWSNYDTHYGHFRRYSRKSLVAVAEKVGLNPLRTSYFFHALYFPARLLSLLDLSRATDIVPPKGTAILFHKAFSWVLRLEYKIIPSWFVGTSVISVMGSGKK